MCYERAYPYKPFNFDFHRKVYATMAERRQQIKAEIATLHNSLTLSDRRLVQVFFGYLGVQGKRERVKNPEQACSFIKHTLFQEGEPTTPFKESEIDWDVYQNFPTIFSSKKKDVIEFLTKDGIGLNDTEQVAVIRGLQVRSVTGLLTDRRSDRLLKNIN